MIKTASLLAVAGLLLANLAWADQAPKDTGSPPKIFPYPVHTTKLDNGLSVILVPMNSEGLVAYWSIVRTGSRDEYEPGRTGFAHFFEHMMFRGTKRFPANEYNKMLTKMGADSNAFTTDDLTAYHLGIAADELETAMDIESDRFKNLSYPEQSFKTEAGAVYGEYRKNKANPFFVLNEAVQEAAFKEHTYGHTTMGYEADIKNMPEMYDYSRSFFERYYRPENVILLITGDIQVEPTLALIRKYYGDWKPGYVVPKVRPEPAQKEERRIDVSYEGQSLPVVDIAYKSPAFDPTDKVGAAATILTELAFGETSDLYQKLVLKDQTVEFLGGGPGMNRDPGLLEIFTRVKDPAKVDAVIAEIDKTIAQFQSTPPDPKRVAELKSRLKYGFLMGLDTPDSVARNLSRLLAITGDLDAVNRMYATLDAVTPADVQAAAREILRPERRTIAVLRGAQ